MVQIDGVFDLTAAAIFDLYQREAEDWRREHLGASVIGGPNECARKLWYRFRWVADPEHDGRLLRLFDRGKREEEWIVEDLKRLGCDVREADPNGEQWRCLFLGGHFGGSCDGAVLGVPEAPKTWHLLEVKTANKKRFSEIRRKGVQEAKPEHYAQMQVYMHGLGLKRALYICVCKDDDHIHTERVYYDRTEALATIERARTVVFSPVPLTKVSEDPKWFECRFCDFSEVCHEDAFASLQRNCRTCASSTAMADGTWRCEHLQETIDGETQRKGCGHHLFVPDLLPWEPIDYDDAGDVRSVRYAVPDGRYAIDVGRMIRFVTPEDE